MNGPEIARFWAKVQRGEVNQCWPWLASVNVNRGGYGQVSIAGTTRRSHIVAYELEIGPVPDGLVLDHLCRTPRCVNPAHLEPVTLAENIRRGMSPSAMAARTNRCAQGHEFTAANTITHSNGKRECRTCENAAQRRRRRARKENA